MLSSLCFSEPLLLCVMPLVNCLYSAKHLLPAETAMLFLAAVPSLTPAASLS